MKRSIRYLILPAILLGGVPAHAEERQNYDAYYDKTIAPAAAPATKLSASALAGVASSFDARRGVPRFIRASTQQPLPPTTSLSSPGDAARWYLGQHLHRYGLAADALQNVEVAHVHDTGRGGIIVTLNQRIDGVEVFRSDVKVLMARNFELVSLSGSPRGSAASETKRAGKKFKVVAPQALANAFQDLYGLSSKASNFFGVKQAVAGYEYFELGSTPEIRALDLHMVEPSRVKKVFFPMPDRLVPAYYLEILAGKTGQATADAYAYVVAADDGRVLYRQNLTEYDAFNYKVFADPDGRPLDGPIGDFTPHPTGLPDPALYPAFVPPAMIAMEGFNHNPGNVTDPWLAANAIQTLGNNVDAYVDDNTPDGFSNGDFRATTTSPKTFDRLYDVSLEPGASQPQSMAALTDLFYVNNWLHDWWYDSGFNEAAGNAQQNNFGRGGLGGDVLHAEGQDGRVAGSRNNANMSTPADGASPRMQMFLWSGINTRSLTVLPLNTGVSANTASFGQKNFDFTAEAALADDGVPVNTNGCEPLTNGAAVAGKIAIIDRGVCTFAIKAKNAQDAGAIGALIVNNAPNAGAPGLGGADPTVTIPVLSTSLEDGNTIKAALQAGPVSLHMVAATGIERDGTIDNGVVAHEWGHYLHHRLVQCGLRQCGGMSEGWGDFTALQMVVRPGDNLDGTFALTIYAAVSFTNAPGYFGIRRYPYSTDLSKNGLTFKHMTTGTALPPGPVGSGGNDNAEVHNMGEIWANMLFEGFTSLLKQSQGTSPRYTFDEARRRMSDYVVGGMKLAPTEPTIVEQRDAILAAAFAADPLDADIIAAAFAKRGAGSCAVAPPIDTTDNAGIVESFAVQPNFETISVTVDDSIKSCDKDGALDANEVGKAVVRVANTSSAPLSNTDVTLTTTTNGVLFPKGPSVTVPTIPAFSTVDVPIEIGLDLGVTQVGFLDLTATVTNPVSCVESGVVQTQPRINYDNALKSSNTDTVESDISAWSPTGDSDASDVWQRVEPTPQNHVWYGLDVSTRSDTQLQSPSLIVSATDPLIISFKHRYQFETGATQFFDGGVIEYSTDDGLKWKDISTIKDPGYNHTIDNTGQNALGGRKGFTDRNSAFPVVEEVSIDLGTALAGQTVTIRFRIGTDVGGGGFGWEVDDLAFSGITNTPFSTVAEDSAKCTDPHPPVANAGPDQTVQAGDTVTLNGSGSTDPDSDPLTYTWTQTAGLIIALSDNKSQQPTFVAPQLGVPVQFTFKLSVSDGTDVVDDFVDILVEPPTGSSSSSASSGSGSSSSSASSSSASSGSSSSSASSGASSGSGSSSSSGSGSGSGSGSSASSGGGSGGDGGEGGSGGDGGGTPSGDGCGCSTPGAETNGGSLGAGLLGLAMFLFRRRRESARRR